MNYQDMTPGEKEAYRQGQAEGHRDGYDSGYDDGEDAALNWRYEDDDHNQAIVEWGEKAVESIFSSITDMVENDVPYTFAYRYYLDSMRAIDGPDIRSLPSKFREIQRVVNERVVA